MNDPRDLIGYGANPPHAQWPNGARIALQLVLNYEEGAERSVLYGDAHAETFLSEMYSPDPFPTVTCRWNPSMNTAAVQVSGEPTAC